MTVSQQVLEKLEEGYSHAVVSWIEDSGYPTSVATGFRWSRSRGVVVLEEAPVPLPGDRDVNVVFSHIRPQPGVGYDDRRYVSLTGRVRDAGGRFDVIASRGYSWDETDVHFVRYSEEGVPRAHEYMTGLSRQTGAEVRPKLSFAWLALRTTRLPFVTAAIVPALLGVAVAAFHTGGVRPGLAGLTVLAAVLIHLGVNVSNDVFDTLSGADAANVTPTQFSGGSRVVHYGLVRMRTLVVVMTGLLAAGIGIGLWLAVQRGFWTLVAIGSIGLVIGVAYTAPPFRLVHRGVGELAVGLGFGPVVVLGAYYVQAQALAWEPFYASLPLGVLIALVLYVNEIPDRGGDAKVGKRTLPVRWSPPAVVSGYRAGVIAAYALMAAGALSGIMPLTTVVALATIPMARSVLRGLREHYDRPYELMPYMGRNVNLHLATGMLLVAAYALSAWLEASVSLPGLRLG